MNPNSDIAASKTLPLGSVAKVTNLDNGKTATVKIEDRGPYVNGRVVDLAPKVADQLDLKQKGVVPGGGKANHPAAAGRGSDVGRRRGGRKPG